MKKLLKTMLFLCITQVITTSTSAQITPNWDTITIKNYKDTCERKDLILDQSYYRFGILNRGNWGGSNMTDQYINIGPGDLAVPNSSVIVAPVDSRFYGVTTSMNSDRLFVGLRGRSAISNCADQYTPNNNTDAVIAWGNDDGSSQTEIDRLIFEYHHHLVDSPGIEIATMLPNGNVGVGNPSPTARFHVDCINGNTGAGVSDVRFENLESGTGDFLAIDANGYVYNSGIGSISGTFWDLNGNTISSTNYLGTKNDDDIRIKTNSNSVGTVRGVIKGGNSTTGGYLGWNTANPTARLHVNCVNGNDEMNFSDIRFENLESGEGNQLAIDANGYVYDSGIPATEPSANNSWEVTGNNITNDHIFGTLNEYSVIIQTEGYDRGILTPGGDNTSDMVAGRLGWNTMNPTARMHVDCSFGNPDDGSQSDIRFENLEHGEGYVLVIADDGYVFNSQMRLNSDGTIEGMHGMTANKERISDLENQIKELKEMVQMLTNESHATVTSPVSNIDMHGSSLSQNTPNPFGAETQIGYYVQQMDRNAYIMIYDLNGREVNRYPVSQGKGLVSVDGSNLESGVYMYSLIIDGYEVDSKRMVLAK